VLNAFTIRLPGSCSASSSAELVDGSVWSRIHDSSSGLLISIILRPLANHAAGIVVGMVGTATVSGPQLTDAIRRAEVIKSESNR